MFACLTREQLDRHTPSPAPCSSKRQGLAGARWEARAAMRCIDLRHTAVGQVRPREASRPVEDSSLSRPRSTRPGCQLATHPRRREAAGRSVDPPCSVPPLRRRVGGRRFFEPDSKQASVFPRRPALMPALVFRIGAATHTHVAIQTFHTLQLRTGLEDEIWGGGFFGFWTFGFGDRIPPPRLSGKAATWLILPVVICLSQRLSHACLSINCFIL